MKTCERGIYELLKSLAGGRVYAMRAPQNAAAPFIIYQRIDTTKLGRHLQGGAHLAQASIQIDVYANDYYAAKDLGAAVETILDGFQGTVYHGTNSPQDFVDIGGISLQNDLDILDETDEPFLHRNSGSYLVTYKQ